MGEDILEDMPNQKNKRWQPGYIYVIDYGDGQTFKIGHTTQDPKDRLSQISRSTVLLPMQLVMEVYTSSNCYFLESILHMELDFFHISGEWFKLDFIKLVELYQCMNFFGGASLHDGWYELVPKDYQQFIEHYLINPNYPFFTKREKQNLYDFAWDEIF